MKTVISLGVLLSAIALNGCTPEVDSKAWCEMMSEKPKGDWSMNEAGDYTKHCLFRSDDEN